MIAVTVDEVSPNTIVLNSDDHYPILTQNSWFYWANLGILVIMEYVEQVCVTNFL